MPKTAYAPAQARATSKRDGLDEEVCVIETAWRDAVVPPPKPGGCGTIHPKEGEPLKAKTGWGRQSLESDVAIPTGTCTGSAASTFDDLDTWSR